MGKSVQISEALFVALCRYHLLDDTDVAQECKKGLETKLDALKRRDLYGRQLQGDEEARQRYLDMIGMAESFRW